MKLLKTFYSHTLDITKRRSERYKGMKRMRKIRHKINLIPPPVEGEREREMKKHILFLTSLHRAIGAMLYTGWLFKELFRSLPDTQSAQIAASRILSLLEEEPQINIPKSGVDIKDKVCPTIKFAIKIKQ